MCLQYNRRLVTHNYEERMLPARETSVNYKCSEDITFMPN